MNTTPLYIFDLDGTLADLEHRRHFVEKPQCTQCANKSWPTGQPMKCVNCAKLKRKPDWDAFHAACVNDTPIQPVIRVLLNLATSEPAYPDIWVWSGRMDTVRTQTEAWLEKHTPSWRIDVLRMRKAGDHTPDDQLKESWLHAMSPEDRARLVMVFDDRQRVVDMWRRNGVVCAQVAPGDF